MSDKKPVITCKDYPIEVAVWENKGEDGRSFFNCTINRTYTVEENGKKVYKQTNSIRQQDLLQASEMLRLAFYRIRALKEEGERDGS